MFLNVIGPLVLKEEEWTEDEAGDDEREKSDANEAPEVEQALMKQRTEPSGGAGLVTKEGSGNEEKVEQQIKRD